MDWKLDDGRPIWPQIKEKLTKDIIAGVYPMGGGFPTVRELAEVAKVNRNTMQRALSELENEGLVITNRTTGRVVTTDEQLIARKKEMIAGHSIRDFIADMKALGYEEEATLSIMKREIEKNRKGEADYE